jgi:hypothetical protein
MGRIARIAPRAEWHYTNLPLMESARAQEGGGGKAKSAFPPGDPEQKRISAKIPLWRETPPRRGIPTLREIPA